MWTPEPRIAEDPKLAGILNVVRLRLDISPVSGGFIWVKCLVQGLITEASIRPFVNSTKPLVVAQSWIFLNILPTLWLLVLMSVGGNFKSEQQSIWFSWRR